MPASSTTKSIGSVYSIDACASYRTCVYSVSQTHVPVKWNVLGGSLLLVVPILSPQPNWYSVDWASRWYKLKSTCALHPYILLPIKFPCIGFLPIVSAMSVQLYGVSWLVDMHRKWIFGNLIFCTRLQYVKNCTGLQYVKNVTSACSAPMPTCIQKNSWPGVHDMVVFYRCVDL